MSSSACRRRHAGLRVGWRLSAAETDYAGFELRLDAARREAVNDNEPEHRFGFGFGITSRW